MLQSLLPIRLKKEDTSYQTVDEIAEVLRHALEAEDIRNIAITGPFGSGKSSVLRTLMEDHKEFHFLPISLATLQANTEGEKESKDKLNKRNDNHSEKIKEDRHNIQEDIENLNRKIEYSILQQIIYKEKDEKIPNSRFSRIIHVDDNRRSFIALYAVLFLISFLILIIPDISFSVLHRLHIYVNPLETLLYFLSVCFVIVCLYKIIKYIARVYANSKLNKLNLKNGEIGVVADNSFFNKHLDEILYFFQVTNYNVVVIEDLDRFETENIFLKLRELNQLINESKIVGRPIVFVYAIRDDIFQNEDRTKFFDYITTIIPVINPSNSKDKLKAALQERGFTDGEVSDDDLSEMAFFIQDMRILTNIANEYYQYRKKLHDTCQKRLNLTKLLAMIVYKNYYPQDFAKLHRRDGLVYKCISSKQQFVEAALKTLEKQTKELESTKKLYANNEHLKENDLRLMFLYGVIDRLNYRPTKIRINKQDYTLKHISEDAELFNQLRSQKDKVTFLNGSYPQPEYVPLEEIAQNMQLDERLKIISEGKKIISQEESNLQKDRLHIQSLPLKVLIQKYNLGETDVYKNLELKPLMDVFIRHGYIDEEYYDYISYFYPGMLSLADRDLLLSIKRQIKEEPICHIDKIDNFVKELKDYMFEHDAILNNELLDYFARKKSVKGKEQFRLMMMRLERENETPLDFLAQYYAFGQQRKEVFLDFIAWNKTLSWNLISAHTNFKEQQMLQEAWLRYCTEPIEDQIEWLNNNYSFLSARVDNIGLSQCEKLLPPCHFVLLDSNSPQLLDMVIKFSCYEINTVNVCIILNHINTNSNASGETLTLTRITDTNTTEVIKYIKNNFAKSFDSLSAKCKEESKENIIYILNSDAISKKQKIEYLTGQQCVNSFKDINEDYWTIAIQAKVISPTWQNVSNYYTKVNAIDSALIEYIEYYHKDLENICDDTIENKDTLFKQLLGTKHISVDAYRSVSKAFDNEFEGNKSISTLDKERLTILLQDNKIAFSEANIGIMQNSAIYAEYLMHFATDFVNNLSLEYKLSSETALKLLESKAFTPEEKCRIIEIINNDVISDSERLAEAIIDVVLFTKNTSIIQKKSADVLSTAKAEKKKVNFVALLLSNQPANKKETDLMTFLLLTALGGEYKDIAERKKHPVISYNEWNINLVNTLESIEYISSKSEEKNGLRIYPKRS